MDARTIPLALEARLTVSPDGTGHVEVFSLADPAEPIRVLVVTVPDASLVAEGPGMTDFVAGQVLGMAKAASDLAVHQATVRGENPRVVGPDRTSPE